MPGRLKIWNAGTSTWEYTSADFSNNMLQVNNETPGGTINGSNTAFTTASDYASGTLKVFKNGIRLKAGGADYTETTSGFTMVTAPATGTVLLVDYLVNTATYSQGVNNYIQNEVPSGLVNGSNTSYTTASSYIGGTLEVYINGLKQMNGTHFTETTPSTGTFTIADAPSTGDAIEVSYQHTLASTSDADTVDGIHANATATANQLMPLDVNATYPQSILQTTTLGYAEYTSNQSGISTLTDLTGLSVTVTVPSGGRRIKVTYCIGFLNGTVDGDRAVMYLREGSTSLNSAPRIVTALGQVLMHTYSFVPTAGSHTYKISLVRDVGTGTLATNSASVQQSFILVELI